MFFFEFVEKGLKFYNQSEIGLHCIIGCDIMGHIHKLNLTEMRLAILILQMKYMKIQCHASKNVILILK